MTNAIIVTDLLAARMIQAEQDFHISRIQSIAEQAGNPQGVDIHYFGNSSATYIRTMPWGIFNAVKGLQDEDAASLQSIVDFYKKKERSFQLDVDPIRTSNKLLEQLPALGLVQTGFHSVLIGVTHSERPSVAPDITIQEIVDDEGFDHYAAIHCLGSGMNLEHKHHFFTNNRGLLHRSGWHIYLALYQNQPAAVATMFIKDGMASLSLAATAPLFRNHGLQTALLQHRLHAASLADCDYVAGQASFGSTSQHNMERVGLKLAWTRSMWAPL